MEQMTRICGSCLKPLTKENTGELGYLQPNCNDCTQKYMSIVCNHTWKISQESKTPICILCGYVEVIND